MLYKKDGSKFWVHLHAFLIFHDAVYPVFNNYIYPKQDEGVLGSCNCKTFYEPTQFSQVKENQFFVDFYFFHYYIYEHFDDNYNAGHF